MVEPKSTTSVIYISDVLRYWLNAVRMEDTLTTRPKAIRQRATSAPLNVYEPTGNHGYFKLPGTEETESFVLGTRDELELTVENDRQSFCGQWLKRTYRKTRGQWNPAEHDVQSLLVGWPTIFFPRTDELAAVLQFHASLEWYKASGDRFFPPDAKSRRRRGLTAPTRLVIVRSDDDDDRLLPYRIDDRLLLNQLGVSDEELADLYETLRSQGTVSPTCMIDALCDCLELHIESPGVDTAEAEMPSEEYPRLKRLASAIQGRLHRGSRAPKLYAVGLGFEGHAIQTTHHLQRDISITLQRLKAAQQVDLQWPLTAYISGNRTLTGWSPMRGQYHEAPLTQDQRQVAERFLGSTLTGVQGPPGTGKTRLIIDLIGSALVERVHALATEGQMGDALFVVASSNNRAVDNVFEPLGHHPVPIGLRSGSQRVTAMRTANDLRQSLSWFDKWPDDDDAQPILDEALREFETLYAALQKLEDPRHAQCVQGARVEDLDMRIGRLEAECAGRSTIPDIEGLNLKAFKRVVSTYARHLDGLFRRLSEHDEVGIRRSHRRLTVPDQAHWRVLAGHFSLDEKPPCLGERTTIIGQDVEAILEQTAHEIEIVEAMRDSIDDYLEWQRKAQQLNGLQAERRQIVVNDVEHHATTPVDSDAHLARCHHRLFKQALAVRSAWLRVHRLPVQDALEACLDMAENRRSIRRLLEQDAQTGRWLRQIFPAFGSTLLSLGNVLPPRQDIVKWVVIDEGGQCHMAHAVSALVRAKHLLVIGDVHQLEPVIQLSADDERRVRKAARITWDDDRIYPYVVRSDVRHSAQVLADRATQMRPTLRAHFRCQPNIISLCDRLCGYGLDIRTPAPERPMASTLLSTSVVFRHTLGTQQRRRGSWENPAERAVVIEILRTLQAAGVFWTDIAVITPYVGQLSGLLEDFAKARIPWSNQDGRDFDTERVVEGVAVGTVHRFQGGERSIVLFTTVVTSEASLGFLNERVNLINVAVSRAREHLIVIGHSPTLKRGRYSRILCTDVDS